MTHTERTSREGISLFELNATRAGLLAREQAVIDHGIDEHLETCDADRPTGRLIAVQVKAGPSWFNQPSNSGFWHPISERHYQYWINHSLPVVVVLCDLDLEVCYWELVTTETCIRAGKAWKIHVPKSNTVSPSDLNKFVDIASPLASASEYTISSEEDVGYANCRRISLDVLIHPGVKSLNKPHVAAIVRHALIHGQNSNYFRDKISEKAQTGRSVEVVSGSVYSREIDRNSGAWMCQFQWVSPNISPRTRPLTLDGETSGEGLVIKWKDNRDLARFLDEKRTSKQDYLARVDSLLEQVPSIRARWNSINKSGNLGAESLAFANAATGFEDTWDGMIAPPPQCARLDQSIGALLAAVGNAGIILRERSGRTDTQILYLSGQQYEELLRLLDDIKFLRKEAR